MPVPRRLPLVVSLAIKTLRTRAIQRTFLTKGAEKGIGGDGERDRVWFKNQRTEDPAITICRHANTNSSELVYTRELIQGWEEDVAALWNNANGRNKSP